MIDPPNKRVLPDEKVFSYRLTKESKVLISRYGKRVTTLSGSTAEAFVEDIANAHGREAQMIMAKAAGSFIRGNERTYRS